MPSAGLAVENGPGALWVNPANLAYDVDPRWGAFFRYDEDGYTPTSAALTAGIGGFSGGVRWLAHVDGRRDFDVDLGLGLRLPRRVAIGGALHWNIEADRNNFVAFDAAIAWRPLPWFGVTALTRNIGNPGGTSVALPQTGGGFAVRPAGRAVIFGVDYLHTFGSTEEPWRVAFTTRVRPVNGLYLRAQVDSRLTFGGGIEVYFGGAGVGLHVSTSDLEGVPTLTGWVGSDERRENISPPRRRVTTLELEEAPAYQPVRPLLRRAEPSWLETLQHFQRAAEDPRIRGMVVTLGGAELSWARWREVRSAILRLRLADKAVLVYLTGSPSNGAVYAASAASEVLAHPAATLDLTGVSLDLVHLRGLLDAVGVDVQVVRRSEYKSAAETLVSLAPSKANEEQQRALLEEAFEELVNALAQGRGRTLEEARRWVDGGPWSSFEAERLGLIDGRAYPDQLDTQLTRLHDGRVRRLDLAKVPRGESPWEPPAEIAIVYIEGTIVSGRSQPPGLLTGRTAGADTISEQLEAAADNPAVRAVVLRVDSPGGSAFASDEIWRAVQRVRSLGKPVVVSMGGVAASGGYYVAAGADAIWAEPTTVTGSIGVVAFKASFAPLLEDLGVTVTPLALGRSAGMESPMRPWDPIQHARMDALVADTYQRFKERVAVGRSLTLEEVEAAARGRVWSGRAAREIGLVDHLGSLTDALAHARELAGLRKGQPVAFMDARQQRSLLQLLLPIPIRLRAPNALGAAVATSLDLDLSPLEPWTALLTLSRHGEESLWLIDPWWTTIRAR